MFTKTHLTLAAALLIATSATSYAGTLKHPHARGFTAFDSKTGDVLADDGKDDGKACAFSKAPTFDPKTGTFGEKLVIKSCNFN